jgi:hypothetical protein
MVDRRWLSGVVVTRAGTSLSVEERASGLVIALITLAQVGHKKSCFRDPESGN